MSKNKFIRRRVCNLFSMHTCICKKHHTCFTRSLKGIIKKNKNPRLNGKKHESQITRIIQTTLDR